METTAAEPGNSQRNIKIGPLRRRFCSKKRHSILKNQLCVVVRAVQIQDATALHSLETESGSSLCAQSRSWARLCPWRWWCLCKSTCSPESEGCDSSPLSPIGGEPHEDSSSKFLLTGIVMNFLKLSINMQIFCMLFQIARSPSDNSDRCQKVQLTRKIPDIYSTDTNRGCIYCRANHEFNINKAHRGWDISPCHSGITASL